MIEFFFTVQDRGESHNEINRERVWVWEREREERQEREREREEREKERDFDLEKLNNKVLCPRPLSLSKSHGSQA